MDLRHEIFRHENRAYCRRMYIVRSNITLSARFVIKVGLITQEWSIDRTYVDLILLRCYLKTIKTTDKIMIILISDGPISFALSIFTTLHNMHIIALKVVYSLILLFFNMIICVLKFTIFSWSEDEDVCHTSSRFTFIWVISKDLYPTSWIDVMAKLHQWRLLPIFVEIIRTISFSDDLFVGLLYAPTRSPLM